VGRGRPLELQADFQPKRMSPCARRNSAERLEIAAILRGCVEGDLPPAMALMRLMIETANPAEALAAMLGQENCRAVACQRARALEVLIEQHMAMWETVHATAEAVRHGPAGSDTAEVARIASAFDRAVRLSPEASVALYSFADAKRLDAITSELVEWLDARGILRPDRDFLDLGCGIGRLAIHLHNRVRTLVGIDVSAEMVRHATERCSEFPNVAIRATSGTDLTQFANASFDGILAIDTFPYLVLEDLAEAHLVEAARVLRSTGDLVIFNYSYSGSPATDISEVRRFANQHGFRVLADGERPFGHWDGAAFHLRLASR
jgi:ubiquinone/menaquinone biosynthesis C-methylase UbiE